MTRSAGPDRFEGLTCQSSREYRPDEILGKTPGETLHDTYIAMKLKDFQQMFHSELFPQHDRREPTWNYLCRKLFATREQIPAGATLLDIGAGESLYKKVFSQTAYTSCDLVSSSDRHDFSNLDVIADASALPFPSASFDYAINMVVLEHVPDPWATTHEMARILKPGGTAYALIPLVRPEHLVPYDFHRFTRYGIRQMFENSGLSVVEIEPSNGALWTAVFYACQVTQQRPIELYGRHSLRGMLFNRVWWALLAPLLLYSRATDGKYPRDFPVYFWVTARR